MAKPVSIRIARLIWGGMFLAIAAGLFAMAAKLAAADAELAAKARQIEGTVIEVVHRGPKRFSYPIVAFTDQTGQRRRFSNTVGSKPPAYARGDRVPVLFDPENPADATIDSFFDRYFAIILLSIMGAGCAFLGFFTLRLR